MRFGQPRVGSFAILGHALLARGDDDGVHLQSLALRQDEQAATAQHLVVGVRGQAQHALRSGQRKPAEVVVGDVGESIEHAGL